MACSDQHAALPLSPNLEHILVEATSGSPVILEVQAAGLGKESLLCSSYDQLVHESNQNPADAIPGEITEVFDETALERMGSNQVSGHATFICPMGES